MELAGLLLTVSLPAAASILRIAQRTELCDLSE